MKGLMKSSKAVNDDPFESEEESSSSDSLFGDLGVKSLFGGSSLFGDSEDECQKSIFEAVVDGDTTDNIDDVDWPAPPDFCEDFSVLNTVRTLALENFDVLQQRSVRYVCL